MNISFLEVVCTKTKLQKCLGLRPNQESLDYLQQSRVFIIATMKKAEVCLWFNCNNNLFNVSVTHVTHSDN